MDVSVETSAGNLFVSNSIQTSIDQLFKTPYSRASPLTPSPNKLKPSGSRKCQSLSEKCSFSSDT